MKNTAFFNSKLPLITFTLLFIFGMIGMFSCQQGPGENSRFAQAQRGQALFQTYCMSCHGENAKGLKIDTMSVMPADLTTISRRRGLKEFPIMEVVRIIDGRNMIKYHGDRPMPIWGEVFAVQEHLDEKQIKGKMGELIAYLMSIQGK